MNIVLFDGVGHQQLLPLTYTKPVSELRVGIFTIKEKWEKHLKREVGVRTKDYLSEKFNGITTEAKKGIYAGVMPDESFLEAVFNLQNGQLLMKEGQVLAISPLPDESANMEKVLEKMTILEYNKDVNVIYRPWDVFLHNGAEIEKDFEFIKEEKEPAQIDATNQVIGDQVFVENGAKVSCSILNSTNGPIYIAKDAEVMEGCIVRGPLALLNNATLKMGAKIYGPSTFGPHCKVGGEVGNSVIQGYSNKGHDGYLGNSVLGEWCNLGADTNTSNLKNNYGEVKVWSYKEKDLINSEQQFCGLIMGDHSKCGINTMFNTGTVVGAFANVFGGGFPAKHIPSFAWGGSDGFDSYQLDKAFEVAERVMSRRGIDLSEADQKILTRVHEDTKEYRN